MFHGANTFSFAAETDNSQAAKLPLEGCFETRQIWSDGHHNAFTGAAFWKGKTYVVFRNAEHHVSFDGRVKILASADGVTFSEAKLVYDRIPDGYNPVFEATPNNDGTVSFTCSGED